MNEIVIPLVSPLSRKYYAHASEKSEHKHHRAEDVRICLEYICDHIIYILCQKSFLYNSNIGNSEKEG